MALVTANTRWHEEVDVGIVGAGGCGLVAAHAAAQAGVRVAIWEQAAAAGGTTALSSGVVPAAGSRFQRAAGIFETGEDLARDVLARAGGAGDAALTRRLCDAAAPLVEWLADTCAVPFELLDSVGDPGHSQRRLHAPASRRGQTLVDALLRTLGRRQIALHLSAPVLELMRDETGAVLGVQVKRPRKSMLNVRCGTLILANDGFAANAELLAQHCTGASTLRYAGAPTSRGDALRWAAEVGAASRDLDAYAAYATAAVGSNLLVPWDVIARGGLLLNQRGTRFADETRGPTALVTPILTQPGRVAYEILDARVLKQVEARDPHFATEVAPRVLRRGDDVGEVARQFQIEPAAAAETVDAYNTAAAGAPDRFGRSAFGATLTAPFYGIRVGVALLGTEGGLAIDANARVLRPDGSRVPNLYAGGGAATGMSGAGPEGYLFGSGLLQALGWGRIAGEQAARECLAAQVGTAPATSASPPEDEPPQ